MVNFNFGKIYKIVGNGNVYIGSTCQHLDIRLAQHNYNYKLWLSGKKISHTTSYNCVIDPNHYIKLLEIYPCNSRVELHNCERKWIEQLDCVNKNIPARMQTPAEYYIKNKEKIKEKQHKYNQETKDIRKNYRQENKENISEYMKKYHQENKENIKEKQIKYNQENKDIRKNYRQQNKEKMTEYNKNYYKNNKENIKEKQTKYRQQNKENITDVKSE